ncbi:MAG: ATP-binding protein [Burkholderiales bacterium]|nr:ATP-binding protein [Burkholderiales bacterium]
MKHQLTIKLVLLWIYLVTVIIVGNIYFDGRWHLYCEVLQIIHMYIVVYLSSKIYSQIVDLDKKTFKWFIWSNICLILSAISYFTLNYLLYVSDVNNFMALAYLIPSFLWLSASLVYWGNLIFRNIKLWNNWLLIFTVLLINLCLAYVLSKLSLKPFSSVSLQFFIFQVYTNIVSFFIFNFTLCVLICANNMGTRLLAAGAISMMGANFLTSYIAYTYEPSDIVYRNDFWLFSSCIFISGLLYLKANYNKQINNFSNASSIKNIITAWTLSIIVLTASIFLGLANYFNMLSSQMLSIIPFIMFVYIIFAVFISLSISYLFEKPIIEINNTIRNFLEHPKEQIKNKINIAEFAVLNDFLQYTIKIVDERNTLQQKFRKTVDQMVHDVGTPLATINMFISSCMEVPEDTRVGVREALSRINGITNEVLDQYNNRDSTTDSKKETATPLILSSTLMQSINEKKYQYRDYGIKFAYDFPKEGNFVFIKMQPNAFKRAISNIINNSVDAVDKKTGEVTLKLEVNEKEVKVIVEDNGQGMPSGVIDKILNNIAVTVGKENGHGIGMGQVRDMLHQNDGKLDIKSRVGLGTKIILTFPRLAAPNWIAEQIQLYKNDKVIILDDDSSIHNAWEKRFKADVPYIQLQHFTLGSKAVEFIHNLTQEEKQKIFLLTDYELINQGLNGLNVIEQTGIKRAILVTSHYANEEVHKLAHKTRTKILPKQLAAEIDIVVKDVAQTTPPQNDNQLKKVDLVIIDDDEEFGKFLVSVLSSNKLIEYYSDVHELLDNITIYPLDTKFSLDNQLPFMSGIDLAKKLYYKGYTNLYMLSGERVDKEIIPPYLTIILKSDVDFLEKLKSL